MINSVAQYFPSLTYLRTVLCQARTHGAAAVFVGDVRADLS